MAGNGYKRESVNGSFHLKRDGRTKKIGEKINHYGSNKTRTYIGR